MSESIYRYMRPGFPKEGLSESGYTNTIEYVGPYIDIRAAGCDVGITWGSYPGLVTSASAEPIEGTDYAILTVVVERKFASNDPDSSEKTGDLAETNEEIDWVDVQRSLFEHPEFRVGGGGTYELTNEDVAAIKKWQEMPSVGYKKDYIYVTGRMEDWSGGSEGTATLSTNAKMFAAGIEQGIEIWIDKAPVVRKSETYVGGPGPKGKAGKKEDPTGVDKVPTGYEWIRNGDRNLHRGGQTRWQRDIEWIGAKKVLVDTEKVYWDAPT